MISPAQAQRDLRDIENHLRLTRNRLQCYEILADEELATATRAVVASLEATKQLLTTRLHPDSHVAAE